MIAGIAISPLLKMNGDEAIAIACAAFCIPTSIVIVLLTALLHLLILANVELQSIANSISNEIVKPNIRKLS